MSRERMREIEQEKAARMRERIMQEEARKEEERRMRQQKLEEADSLLNHAEEALDSREAPSHLCPPPPSFLRPSCLLYYFVTYLSFTYLSLTYHFGNQHTTPPLWKQRGSCLMCAILRIRSADVQRNGGTRCVSARNQAMC